MINETFLFSIALRIPSVHDYHVIRARTWTPARTQRKRYDFPQAKLDSEINAGFLSNERGDLYTFGVKI